MAGRAEEGRDRGDIAKFDVSKVLHEPVIQTAPRWTNVQGKKKREGYTVNNIIRDAVRGVGDMIRAVMCASEDGGVEEVGAGTTAWSRKVEGARSGGKDREENVEQITQVMEDKM